MPHLASGCPFVFPNRTPGWLLLGLLPVLPLARGEPGFQGQVLFNPGAGTLCGLQRRMFDGPWTFDIGMRLKNTVNITETKKVELLMDAFFGVVSSMFYTPRIVQFGLHYTF